MLVKTGALWPGQCVIIT